MKKVVRIRSLLTICATAAAISAIAIAGWGCDDSGINKGASGKVDAFLGQFSGGSTDSGGTTINVGGFELEIIIVPPDAGKITEQSQSQDGTQAYITVVSNDTSVFRFIGWTGDGLATKDSENAIVLMTQNRTITANFHEARFTVSFDANGGNPGTIEAVRVDSGKALGSVTLPSDPTMAAYNFDGWFDERYPYQPRYTDATVINSDVALMAMWRWGRKLGSQFNPNISYDSFTDGRDGQNYSTVVIGNQTWMAENLNYETVRGSCCYDDDEDNCAAYGRLYAWDTAMTACPDGWHLPDTAEWGTLVTYAGGASSNVHQKLKAKIGWSNWNNSANGTDDYGFSALPGGDYFDGTFWDIGYSGRWWSASESSRANRIFMSYNNNDNYDYIYEDKYGIPPGIGFSVRCIQDQ